MWQMRVLACSAVCFDRPSSQNEHVSGNRRSMMCQFQYQIDHCEIAMDTSMTSPLSARITNKGRNWFAQSVWLRRIALNSLRFYCSSAIEPHPLSEDLAQHPRERSLEYARRRPRNWGGVSTQSCEFFLGASHLRRANRQAHP